jgi:hypothetical protein
MWDNIQMRAKVKQRIFEISTKENLPDLMEAEFVILANDTFHKVVEKVIKRSGKEDHDAIYFEWNEWLEQEVKRIKAKILEKQKAQE